MAILDKVKNDLGIGGTARDTQITLAIETAKAKLGMTGVDIVAETDEYTCSAIIMFCRAWFNFQGDGERYEKAFQAMADSMSMASEYAEEQE